MPIRFVALSLLLAIPGIAAADFPDIAGHPYRDAILYAQNEGIIQGYPDGTFRPEATINRAEFVKIVIHATYPQEMTNCLQVYGRSFPDVEDNAWFAPYICAAKKLNLVKGNPDGAFHPERNINFVEAAKIIVNATGAAQETQQFGDEWFKANVDTLAATHAIPASIPSFDHNLTRGEMAEMVWRLRTAPSDGTDSNSMSRTYTELDEDSAFTTTDIPAAGLRVQHPANRHWEYQENRFDMGGDAYAYVRPLGATEWQDMLIDLYRRQAQDPMDALVWTDNLYADHQLILLTSSGGCRYKKALLRHGNTLIESAGFCIGENERDWNVLVRALRTMEFIPVADENSLAFDACGPLSSYKNRSWYPAFIARLHRSEIDAYTGYENETFPSGPLDQFLHDDTEGCASLDGSLFLTTFNVDYCSTSGVLRYDILRDRLTMAVEAYEDHCASLGTFGKRTNAIIPVSGVSGDAGCAWEATFDYDIVHNTLRKAKSCTSCQGETEMCETY